MKEEDEGWRRKERKGRGGGRVEGGGGARIGRQRWSRKGWVEGEEGEGVREEGDG